MFINVDVNGLGAVISVDNKNNIKYSQGYTNMLEVNIFPCGVILQKILCEKKYQVPPTGRVTFNS